MAIGLLTTRDHPLLPHFLDALGPSPGFDIVLLFDEKPFGEKDARLFAERTNGRFPAKPLEPHLARFDHVDVPSHNDPSLVDAVSKLGIEMLVNAGTPRKIQTPTLRATRRGVLNVHPGILPKYRGASCCEWALHLGEPVGVSAHFMDERIDGGPLLFTRELPIHPRDHYVDIRVKLYELAHAVRVEAIRHVLARDLEASKLPPQPDGPVFAPIPDELFAALRRRIDGEAARA